MRTVPAQQTALADHQHSRVAPGSVDATAFDDSVYGGTPTSVDEGDTGAAGTAATLARSDHQHAVTLTVPPVGSIIMYGGGSAPTGWLLCIGSAVSRTTYADLYAVLGDFYGAGDGSTTFNLPDLQQRFPLGQAPSGTGSTRGATGGSIDHVHGLDTASSGARIRMDTAGNEIVSQRKSVTSWNTTHISGDLTTTASSTGSTLGTALTGDSGTANPPFQVVNFIIRH